MTDSTLVFGDAHLDPPEFMGGPNEPCADGYINMEGQPVEVDVSAPEFCRVKGLCPPALEYPSPTTEKIRKLVQF